MQNVLDLKICFMDLFFFNLLVLNIYIFRRLAREYNWNVKNKASKGYEENYYFVFRDDGVYYNELETR